MKISQAEAHRLKRRVKELERLFNIQRHAWGEDWPNGVVLGNITTGLEVFSAVRTARRLGHPVVVTHNSDTLVFTAIDPVKI